MRFKFIVLMALGLLSFNAQSDEQCDKFTNFFGNKFRSLNLSVTDLELSTELDNIQKSINESMNDECKKGVAFKEIPDKLWKVCFMGCADFAAKIKDAYKNWAILNGDCNRNCGSFIDAQKTYLAEFSAGIKETESCSNTPEQTPEKTPETAINNLGKSIKNIEKATGSGSTKAPQLIHSK